MELSSCDSFVVLPSHTAHGGVIFGKNSDRPKGEVQELIYVPGEEFAPGTKVECTYIEIDQVEKTHAVILSKPAWMWGAEMGANEKGVCIGNEAVWTAFNSIEDRVERLLGMDMVRLALERASTADEAVSVITKLLEEHGQGGNCSDILLNFTYHNSFLIADLKEAWVLETAGKLWAAEKITEGVRNISNSLTIGTKIDRMSTSLHEEAQKAGLWDGKGSFNMKKSFGDNCTPIREVCGQKLLERLSEHRSFSERDMFAVLRDEESGISMGTDGFFVTTSSQGEFDFAKLFGKTNDFAMVRATCGAQMLEKYSSGNKFDISHMLKILRDSDSGICRDRNHEYPTTGSQVSVLSAVGSGKPCCHWFTATPDPNVSVFKPFVFTSNAQISHLTKSPVPDPCPAKSIPRFQTQADRAHTLYKYHMEATSEENCNRSQLIAKLRAMEEGCVIDVQSFLDSFEPGQSLSEMDELLKDVVETEVKFYK